jgi:serine/threonine protein kinase
MPVDPQRIQAVFLAAVEAGDPAAEAVVLDRECASDLALRRRVEALLLAHRDPASILDRAPLAPQEEMVSTHTHDVVAVAGPGVPKLAGDAFEFAFLEPPRKPGALGRLHHYEILEVLGRGGFGIVFRALDETLQRVVAVKVLAPQMAATSPARKRFLREARAYARIRHENVVQVHAVEEKPLPYLVMEYVPGGTLQQLLDSNGPLDAPEVVRLGRQIAEGLVAAHATGFIHRDVKPANVLIEDGPIRRVKLTDFGLARTADDASISQSGLVAGTPLYMAPEQARGEALDHRADLFSLGSVFYVMCTGRPPFRANGAMAILKRVCEDTPRPIREIIPETPAWLCELIGRLHAKDRGERIRSAREVADVLAAHRSDAGKGRSRGAKPRRITAVAVACILLTGVAILLAAHLWTRNGTPAEERLNQEVEIPKRTSRYLTLEKSSPGQLPWAGRTSWFAHDPVGQWLVVPCENNVVFFDAQTLTPRKVLRAATERIYQVDFSPDGKLLAVGAWLDHDSVSIWDVETGTQCGRLPLNGDCRFLQFSPDGTKLLTVGIDHVPIVWDARTGAELGRFPAQLQPLCADATFCAGGKQVVTHERGGDLIVWEWQASQWKKVTILTGPEQVATDGTEWEHYPIVASRDGKWLAAGSPSRFTIWETGTWKQKTKTAPASWLAFAPDGLTIFTGAHEHADDRPHTVTRWKTHTGEPVRGPALLSSRGPWAVYHLSLDGKTLYAMTCDPAEPSIHVYDAETFQERLFPDKALKKGEGQ